MSGPDRTHTVALLPVPGVTRSTGLLRVEASGICGTDVGLVRGGIDAPAVLGHHIVGVLEAAGRDFLAVHALEIGDQVVVEEYLPCGQCAACRVPNGYRFCPQTDLFRGGRRIGLTPADEPPGLWGGNAQYLHLPANAVLHPVRPPLPSSTAVWTLPLANALDWIQGSRPLDADDSVLIIGPGQHGLAAVAAARLSGAGTVLACGLSSDLHRLTIAEALGADDVIVADDDDPVGAVMRATGGLGADCTIVTAGPVETALDMTARQGTVVLAGGDGPPIESRRLVRDALTLRGARGRDPVWIRMALHHLGDGITGLDTVPTETVGLEAAGHTLTAMAEGRGPAAPHVVIYP